MGVWGDGPGNFAEGLVGGRSQEARANHDLSIAANTRTGLRWGWDQQPYRGRERVSNNRGSLPEGMCTNNPLEVDHWLECKLQKP